MAELTAPGGTSSAEVRLGRDAQTTTDKLGPLADLVGTWIGTQGWELIAVPSGDPGEKESFTFIARPYVEVITFQTTGSAPVPNRGGPAGEMSIYGLVYEIRIADLVTNEPLHLETGMFLNLSDVKGGMTPENPIVRSATIPHGDSVLALGTSFGVPGPPDITPRSGVPDPGPDAPLGYADAWQVEIPSPCDPASKFNPAVPTQVLTDALAGLNVVNTTTLSLSTDNGGGILNIPFVDAYAAATKFDCVFWIETIEATPPGGGEPNFVQQLQYFQQTNIEFLPQFGNPDQLIMWPHVNVNTMRKQ
jgi:hypothetical protein